MKIDAALAAMTDEFRQRAWTMRSHDGTCWKSLYAAPSWRDLVPRFYWTVEGETFRVRHREVIYYLLHGIVPPRLSARCGNPSCVNPQHMTLHMMPSLERATFTQADRDECMMAGHEWRRRDNGRRVVNICICCGEQETGR